MDSRKDHLNIHLIVYGTPAEEGGGGKILMLNEGVFKDLDICMMSHPAIGEIPDAIWLATTAFKFYFEGIDFYFIAINSGKGRIISNDKYIYL